VRVRAEAGEVMRLQVVGSQELGVTLLITDELRDCIVFLFFHYIFELYLVF